MIPGANPLQYSAAYAQMLGLAGFTQQQQSLAQAQAGRVSAVSAAANPYAAQAAALTAAYGQQGLQTGSAKALTQAVNVKFKNLPFYDIHGELLKPTSLVTQGKLKEIHFPESRGLSRRNHCHCRKFPVPGGSVPVHAHTGAGDKHCE